MRERSGARDKTETMETQSTVTTRKRRSKITPELKDKVIALSKKNLTTREVEALTTVDHTTVAKILQRYGLEKQNIDHYISQRPQILAGLQEKILQSIDEDDLKKTPAAQRTMMFGILYDKERLETGKSTANVQGIYHIISEIERSERKKVVSDSDIDASSGKSDTPDSTDMGANDDAS